MKKYKDIGWAALSFLVIALLAVSCRKVDQKMIDGKYPDQRVSEFINEVKSELLDAENGWVGYMYIPENKLGYTFYMDFKAPDRVTMYSDVRDTTTNKPRESSFTIRNTEEPALIFDTYNYIHIPSDPKKSVSGGESGVGLYADFEYAITKLGEDSIFLEGIFNGCDMVMVKLDAQEQNDLQNGALEDVVGEFKDFFVNNRNNYVDLSGGGKLGIDYSNGSKQFTYNILEDDGSVTSLSTTFYYAVTGLVFKRGFSYNEQEFIGAEMEGNTMYMVDAEGNKLEVKQNPIPVTPLPPSFSYDGTYSSIFIDGETLPSGVTSGWNQVYQDLVDRFHGSGREIISFEFVLYNDSKARINMPYISTNGHSYTADAQFDYERDGDEITFSNFVPSYSNGNWNSRESDIGDLPDYFDGRTFKIDWVAGSGQDVLGGFYPTDDPTEYFYGLLK